MYKIVLVFNSGIDGIYTKEEETASDTYWRDLKYNRMVNRWLSILHPHINIGVLHNKYKIKTKNISCDSELAQISYKVIQDTIKSINEIFNENASFCITITEF